VDPDKHHDQHRCGKCREFGRECWKDQEEYEVNSF